MLRIQDLTPKVYTNQSRDFQLIGRLYDLVMNSIKTNTDLIYNCPLSENSDKQLMDLMALTLGFQSKHNYNLNQLTALCSAFTYVIRNKGNITSIISACNALVGSEGISETIQYEWHKDEYTLDLYIPQALSDTNLLKDLLNYILPAGISCNIIKEQRITTKATNNIGTKQSVTLFENVETNTIIPTISTLKEYAENYYPVGIKPQVIVNSTIWKKESN